MAAPVTIKVDLDATPALNELAELEVLMQSIGHDFRDMDTGSVTGDIQEMVSALEDAEDRMKNVRREMEMSSRAWNQMDFADMPDGFATGGGDDGGGGVSMATGGGSQKDSTRDLIRKLDNIFGTMDGEFRTGQQLKLFDGQRRGPNGQFISNTRDSLTDEASQPARGRFGGLTSKRMRRMQDSIDWSVGSTRASTARAIHQSPKARLMDQLRGMMDINGNGRITSQEYVDSFESRIKKLMPTMRKWWQLLALIIPLLIAAGVQALGVAAALGAMAVAGASIIGLGLIGHADSMGEAFERAKMEVRDFKREMFEVFSPTAQAFSGVQAEFMDFAPDELYETARAMEGLVVYSDLLFNTWSALAGGTAEFFDILVRNEQIVSQLTDRFGGLIGSGLLEVFEWLLQAGYENQNMLLALWDVLVSVAVTIYNVSMAVSTAVAAFAPFFHVLVAISELLNNEFVINLMVMVALLYSLGKLVMVGYAIYGAFMAVASAMKTAAIMSVNYTLSTWQAVAATLALAGAIGLITFGASTLIGGAITSGVMAKQAPPTGPSDGYGPDGPGGSGMTVVNNYESNYNFENNGSMDNGREQRFRTQFKRMDGEKKATSTPNPPTRDSSSTTDGGNSGGK